MKRLSVFSMVVLSMLVFPVLAFAQQAATTTVLPWWNQLLQVLLQLVVAILLAIIPLLVAKIYGLVAKWLNLKEDEQTQARIAKLVSDAVNYADEWAHKKLKAGTPVAGEAKFEKAMDFAIRQAKEMGLDTKLSSMLSGLIVSALGAKRAGAAPAAGTSVSTPPTAPPSNPPAPSA